MADDTFMNTVCTLHDATSLINSSPTTTDPTNSGTTPGSTDGTAAGAQTGGAGTGTAAGSGPKVKVVLIPAAPGHPVTLIVNHYDLQLNYLKQNPQGSYPRGFLLMYIC